MPNYNAEREATIRLECRGKAMVNAHYIYELFDVIKQLVQDRKEMADMLLKRERQWGVAKANESLPLMTMRAHRGQCEMCGNLAGVVMRREPDSFALCPDFCWCMECGQRYHMIIPDINAWEKEQWEQKNAQN